MSTTEVTGRTEQLDCIRRHAELFDTRRQAVIATTLPGEIVYWNETAERLYGWAAAEVEGRSILDVTPTTASQEQASEIMAQLRSGRSWSGEFAVRHRRGDEFRVLVRDVPVRDARGNFVGVVGISSRR